MRQERSIRLRKAAVVGAVGACVLGLALSSPVTAAAQQDPAGCPKSVGLTNSSFEQPDVRGPGFVAQDQVPGWQTTATDRLIELWGPGNAAANRGVEVPAVTGDQFAELNATQASTLYQDVATTPGQRLRWRISHRARNVSGGVDRDTMQVLIGTVPQTPDGATGPNIVDDDTAWGHWTGTYTVPDGQTTTRFAFKAVRSSSGNPTLGNFLDAIEFGTPACLITTKSVQGPNPAHEGDELTYTVEVTNGGGAAALDATVTDPVPDGGEYVPGSLTLNGGALTDDPGDDAGELSGKDTVVRIASPFTAGDTATIAFRVRVDGTTTPLLNTATVDFGDALTGDKAKSTSNTTSSPVVVTTPTTPTPPPAPNGDAAPPLPNTGVPVGAGLAVAASLLAAGGFVGWLGRRRRRA